MSLRPEGLSAGEVVELRVLQFRRDVGDGLPGAVLRNRLAFLEEQERRFSTPLIPKGEPNV
jgi:hypothetical protein